MNARGCGNLRLLFMHRGTHTDFETHKKLFSVQRMRTCQIFRNYFTASPTQFLKQNKCFRLFYSSSTILFYSFFIVTSERRPMNSINPRRNDKANRCTLTARGATWRAPTKIVDCCQKKKKQAIAADMKYTPVLSNM